MLCLLVGGRDESSDESKIRRALDREARSLSRFHPYLFLHVRTPPCRSRHPASFPRQPAVCPPDDHHPRTQRLHSPSARRPTIEILLPPENLPILEWLGIKTSKSL